MPLSADQLNLYKSSEPPKILFPKNLPSKYFNSTQIRISLPSDDDQKVF